MGIFFGVLVGFVLGLVLAGAAFIEIVSTDNGRGYQPNKPLDGPPPNVRGSVQYPVWAQRNRTRIEIDHNYFYYDGIPIGTVADDKPYVWCIHILKSQCETCYNSKTRKLEVLPIRGQTEDSV
jgi:hypothetical protein